MTRSRGQGLGNRCPPGRATSRISMHHDHRAGEQPAVGAGEPGQGVHLGVLIAERPVAGRASCRPRRPWHPSAFSGPRLAPPISDTAETATIPGTDRGSTCRVLEVLEQARDPGGRWVRRRSSPTTTPARRRDRHPPPMPAEPARIRIRVPVAPEPDHSDEHQAGDMRRTPRARAHTPSAPRTAASEGTAVPAPILTWRS